MTRASLFYTRQKAAAVAHAGDPLEQTIKLAGVTMGDCPRIVATLRVGEQLFLHREPDNPHDANAIRVDTKAGEKAGYIPRGFAALLATVMGTEGASIVATIQNLQGDPSRGQSRGVTILFRTPTELPLLQQLPDELDI